MVGFGLILYLDYSFPQPSKIRIMVTYLKIHGGGMKVIKKEVENKTDLFWAAVSSLTLKFFLSC